MRLFNKCKNLHIFYSAYSLVRTLQPKQYQTAMWLSANFGSTDEVKTKTQSVGLTWNTFCYCSYFHLIFHENKSKEMDVHFTARHENISVNSKCSISYLSTPVRAIKKWSLSTSLSMLPLLFLSNAKYCITFCILHPSRNSVPTIVVLLIGLLMASFVFLLGSLVQAMQSCQS